jgi:hypothetical protein
LTDEIILMVTPSTILSVEMSRHRIIFLLESHYNTLRNVIDIYRRKFSIDIFTDEFYRRINYVSNVVSKTYTSLYCLIFLFFIFPLQFPLYIPWEYLCWCLPIDLAMEILVSKYHRNIPTEKFYQYFRLYLLIFMVVIIDHMRDRSIGQKVIDPSKDQLINA